MYLEKYFFIFNPSFVLIITTSILGSYAIVRSISVLFGGYPNEFTLKAKLMTGDYSFVIFSI